MDKYVYSIGLYEYSPGFARTSAISNSTAAAAQVIVSTSISLSIMSNPSAAWTLLNTIQMIQYIPLNSNPLTPGLQAFIKGLGQYNIMPNTFSYIFDSNATGPPYLQASNYGFTTSVFLINFGPDTFIFLLLLSLWPFILLISKIPCGKISMKMIKILGNYQYSFFLRFWTQAYLDIGIFAIIQLIAVSFT